MVLTWHRPSHGRAGRGLSMKTGAGARALTARSSSFWTRAR